jgi:predicted phosphodiesterase
MTRTALLADIHGNSPALRAVLAEVERAGCTQLYVLGDIINGQDPTGCVNLLQSASVCTQSLRGNAEDYLLTPELEAFPKSHEPLYAYLIRLLEWWKKRLSPAQLSWLRSLPDTIRWNSACLAHDSPLDRLFKEQHFVQGIDAKYQELLFHSPGIYPETNTAQLEPLLNWMDTSGVSQVYIGHTHMPFIAWHGSRMLCNVGSVGQPPGYCTSNPQGSCPSSPFNGRCMMLARSWRWWISIRIILISDNPACSMPISVCFRPGFTGASILAR